MSDIAELKRLAQAATPGPWNCLESNNSSLIHIETGEGCPIGQGVQVATANRGGRTERLANAEYIAAANPQAILALIERLEKLEAELSGWMSGETQPGFACGRLADPERTFVGGCGQHVDMNESYRCSDCTASFHRDCLRKHFEAERKGTVRLTLEQALNVQRALQRAQYLCEESAGESSGEETQVYTRDLEALGEALDVIGEVCITDEGWLAAAIKEAASDRHEVERSQV